MTPSLPFVRPASVHMFDVSLKTVFLLMIVFVGRPAAWSADSLLAAAQFYSATMGAIGCLLAFTLAMLCLIISFFLAHAMMALSRKIAFSGAGSMLRYLPLQLLQSSSVNTPSPSRVSCALKSAWSAPCCRTSSVKVMALSKSWYRLYPLGLTAFALNSGESQTDGSCLKSPNRTTERFPNGLSL